MESKKLDERRKRGCFVFEAIFAAGSADAAECKDLFTITTALLAEAERR